jgi:hypothetical protein
VRQGIRTIRSLGALLLVAVGFACAHAAGLRDPLPSWNDGPAKREILRFVAAVTEPGGPQFVPPAERIAVFDHDGTLLAERPSNFQLDFLLQRIRDLAPSHPDWKVTQPFAAVLANDADRLEQMTLPELEQLVLAASAGITEKEYQEAVHRFLDEAEHPDHGRKLTEMVYEPMRELLHLLQDERFRVFICSAAGPEMLRAFSEEVYGVPRERVIGSDMEMRYERRDGEPVLLREPRFVMPTNIDAGKPVNIDRTVGRGPIFAFGNSDGDIEMLEFTAYAGLPHLALLLRHDDAEREYAYDDGAEQAFALAPQRGWLVVSMKQSFRRIFPALRD